MICLGAMMLPSGAQAFSRHLFGHADLGDIRRTRALVDIVTGLVRRPAGRMTQVFHNLAARERAYRFLENAAIEARALLLAMASAIAGVVNKACRSYVVIDGSSLTLADPQGRKDFGQIGANNKKGRGLKVITAYAVDMAGVPIGVLGQEYWARQKRVRRGRKAIDNRSRPTKAKETQRWLDVILGVLEHGVARKAWFLIDREGDSRVILCTLAAQGALFTIRSSWDRLLVAGKHGARRYLRSVMRKAPLLSTYAVEVTAGPKRKARTARMQVRVKRVQLMLIDRWSHKREVLEVNVVWATEVGTTPQGEEPLNWMLLTNAPVATPDDALAVIRSYQIRWRIEEFHKAWKSGTCNVEQTQLHSMHAATMLAVMHAAVAARAERLKHAARTTPNLPAATELDATEREAIALLAYEMLNQPVAPGGRRQSKLMPPDPKTMTIAEAVLWIARLGGYTGKSSGGPPGGVVISRGLCDVVAAAHAVSAIKAWRHK